MTAFSLGGGNGLYAFDPATKAPVPLGETFQWGLYDGEELIGWHHAHQQDERTVYMADTGVLPEHQGRGLYSRLLPPVLESTARRATPSTTTRPTTVSSCPSCARASSSRA